MESNVLGKGKTRKSNLAQSRNVNRKYIIKKGRLDEGGGGERKEVERASKKLDVFVFTEGKLAKSQPAR